MVRAVVCLLLCAFVAVNSTPQLEDQSTLSISVGDAPAIVKKPDPPTPSEDGVIVEQVVNVKKTALVIVTSFPTEEGAKSRQIIRDTWLQALNRTSPFAMDKEDRKRFNVWFAVNTPSGDILEQVQNEGKLNGDMLLVSPAQMSTGFHRLVSLARWIRVAYYERFDYILFTNDDSFVSLYNLKDLCDHDITPDFFYGGFVNSFEKAPAEYGHTYYAPYVDEHTILISADVAEVISRELPFIRPLATADTTLGNFLSTYAHGKPHHIPTFVPNFKNTYSNIEKVVVAGHVTEELMRFLSNPVSEEGKWVTPALPAQIKEFSSRTVYVDPHPTGNEPACDGFSAARCGLDALRAQQQLQAKHK